MKICLSSEMAARIGNQIRQIAPRADLVTLRPDGSFGGDPSGVEVLLFSVDLSFDESAMAETVKLMQADSLAWIQAPGAGLDHPIWSGILERGVRLTNASGIHAEPIAQYLIAYLLHWERNVRRHQAQQAARTWEIIISGDLTAKTIGIVGLGGIGSATARVAKALGMRVLALRRSDTRCPDVDRHCAPEELHDLLAESDYVVLCMPLTEETRHLIGADELAAMGRDSVLINVARGGVVDESALIDALERRDIRGATLDVTEVEPLPDDSPLWSLDNCVVTPHDAGYSPRAGERLGRLFLENLRLYREGAALRNEIRS